MTASPPPAPQRQWLQPTVAAMADSMGDSALLPGGSRTAQVAATQQVGASVGRGGGRRDSGRECNALSRGNLLCASDCGVVLPSLTQSVAALPPGEWRCTAACDRKRVARRRRALHGAGASRQRDALRRADLASASVVLLRLRRARTRVLRQQPARWRIPATAVLAANLYAPKPFAVALKLRCTMPTTPRTLHRAGRRAHCSAFLRSHCHQRLRRAPRRALRRAILRSLCRALRQLRRAPLSPSTASISLLGGVAARAARAPGRWQPPRQAAQPPEAANSRNRRRRRPTSGPTRPPSPPN